MMQHPENTWRGGPATADWEKALQNLVDLASFLVGVVVLGDKISLIPKSSLQKMRQLPRSGQGMGA